MRGPIRGGAEAIVLATRLLVPWEAWAGAPADSVCPRPVVQIGHNNDVGAIAFSPDGALLATGGEDNLIKLWEVATGKVLRNFSGHEDGIKTLRFSADGLRLFSGSKDHSLRVWDVATGRVLRQREAIFSSARVSQDGKRFIVGVSDEVIVLDAASGKELRVLKDLPGRVNTLGLSPDERLLAAGSREGKIVVWALASGKVVARMGAANAVINGLAFSPDGRTLASGGDEALVRTWDIQSGQAGRTFASRHNNTYAVAFSPDGRYLMGSGLEPSAWDLATGKEVWSLDRTQGCSPVYSLAFTPDGQGLAIGGYGCVALLRPSTGEQIMNFRGLTDVVRQVAFARDNRHVVARVGTQVKIWDLDGARLTQDLRPHEISISAFDLSPDDKTIATGAYDGKTWLWDARTGQVMKRFRGHKRLINAMALSVDGKTLASGADDNTIKLFDLSSGSEIRTLVTMNYKGVMVQFSADGKTLATQGLLTPIQLWDVATGRALRDLGESKRLVKSALSPDGARAVGCYRRLPPESGGPLVMFEASSGKRLWTAPAFRDTCDAITFSADGKLVAAGGHEGRILLFQASDGKQAGSFAGQEGTIHALAFSPDGKLLVSGGDDGMVHVWGLQSHSELADLVAPNNGGWLIITPDGYFDGSLDAGASIAMVEGNRAYSLDQFALRNQRPVLILERLGRKRP